MPCRRSWVRVPSSALEKPRKRGFLLPDEARTGAFASGSASVWRATPQPAAPMRLSGGRRLLRKRRGIVPARCPRRSDRRRDRHLGRVRRDAPRPRRRLPEPCPRIEGSYALGVLKAGKSGKCARCLRDGSWLVVGFYRCGDSGAIALIPTCGADARWLVPDGRSISYIADDGVNPSWLYAVAPVGRASTSWASSATGRAAM